MTALRKMLAASAVAGMVIFSPMTDVAGAKQGDQTCTSRGSNKGGTCNTTVIEDGDGNTTPGHGSGKHKDQCDFRQNGWINIGGILYQCHDNDVVDIF